MSFSAPAHLTASCASGVVAIIVATFMSATASAQPSRLHGVVFTTSAPSLQQTFTSTPVCSLSGLRAIDVIGNDALAKGTLNVPEGRFNLSTHACSGGAPGFGGQANASADSTEILDYSLSSTTIAPGTPVMVKIRWAVKSRVTGIGQDLVGANSGGSATASGQIAVAISGVNFVNDPGTYTRSHSTGSGIQTIQSGALSVLEDSGEYEVAVPFGQILRLFLSGTAACASSSEGGSTTDGDAQMSMVWGLTSLDPAATVILHQSNPPEPAAPAEMATPADAIENLPDRPDYVLPCFRMPGQPDSISRCVGQTAAFAAVPLGTGPFTYQWRKNGVFIDTIANPSAATFALSLPNVIAADAGTYDCVITNPCGGITSDAAVLTIDAGLDIAHQPTPVSACPAGSAQCSVEVESTDTLTYEWQVQDPSSTGWTSPGDAPGTALPCGGTAFVTPLNSRIVSIGIRPCPGLPTQPQQLRVRCIITGPCGPTTSAETTYTICPADFNCSGNVTVQDIFDFLGAYFTSDPGADFNVSGTLSVQDIFDFLAAYFVGCS